MTEFEQRVLAIVGELQEGQLVSYGWVASEAGSPAAARAVGRVLGSLRDDSRPWWRVVSTGGRIVSPRPAVQRARLRADLILAMSLFGFGKGREF